jgi:hypothetical protein
MNPVRFMRTVGAVNPASMVVLIMFVFLLAVLGAAFTPILQTQVNSWSSNLTAQNQTAAAAIVTILPLIFWILIAVAIILVVVKELLPGAAGGL